MSVFQVSFTDAQTNYSKRNRHSKWIARASANPATANERMKEKVFRPSFKASRRLAPTDTIFTVGSCFARNAERQLSKMGYRVTSVADDNAIPGVDEKGPGWANRYNTRSILRELEWASGEREYPKAAILQTRFMRYVDMHSHPMLGEEPYKIVDARRRKLIEYFGRAFSASMITITLGLTEVWYDRNSDDYLNFLPNLGANAGKQPLLSDPKRFEFRVLDFQENMENLEAIYALIKRHNPRAHIVVTVSPVSLIATFTERDVTVANCMSKSTLRTCAETWTSLHPGEIDYFPSYEMATLSDRKLVYQEDGIHITNTFVRHIMNHFVSQFFEGGPPVSEEPEVDAGEQTEAAAVV